LKIFEKLDITTLRHSAGRADADRCFGSGCGAARIVLLGWIVTGVLVKG